MEQSCEEMSCRICGCTEERACEGGCFWVEDPEGIGDLCSQCLTTSRCASCGWWVCEGPDAPGGIWCEGHCDKHGKITLDDYVCHDWEAKPQEEA